jgi:hypothetical protein
LIAAGARPRRLETWPHRFPTWVEKFCVTFRQKKEGEKTPISMGRELARQVVSSQEFVSLFPPSEPLPEKRRRKCCPALPPIHEIIQRDRFAESALEGIVDRVLFDQHFEDVFTRGCKTKKAKSAKAATLPAFCASIAYDVADAMMAERRVRGHAS